MGALANYSLSVANNLYRAGTVLARNGGTISTSGSPNAGDFLPLGIVKNVEVNIDMIETDPDTAGRTKELGFNCSATFMMKQTADSILQNLSDLTDQLMDVLITPDHKNANVDPGLNDTNLAVVANEGFVVQDILMNVGGNLNLTGDQSALAVNLKWRYGGGELGDIPVETGTGINLVQNSEFVDATVWILGVGWSIANGRATASASSADIEQNMVLAATSNYEVRIATSGVTAGTLTPRLGGTSGAAWSTNGVLTQVVNAGAGGDPRFELVAAAFSGNIDSVVCRLVQ